jgi:lipoprotein LprG
MTPHRPLGRALALLAVLVSASLVLSGCGKDEPKAKEKSPSQVLETAKKKFDDAGSVHIELSTDSVPDKGNAVLGANGDLTHDPAFEGEVKAYLEALSVTSAVPIIAVDGKVYAKLPFTTKYQPIPPEDYGAPDPADFASPDDGLSALLTKLDGVKEGDKTRSGDMILTTYSGTLPGAAVKKIIPSADAKATYETTIGVDEDGYARSVKVTGPFFASDGDVTYDVLFSDYGKSVKISAPTG